MLFVVSNLETIDYVAQNENIHTKRSEEILETKSLFLFIKMHDSGYWAFQKQGEMKAEFDWKRNNKWIIDDTNIYNNMVGRIARLAK